MFVYRIEHGKTGRGPYNPTPTGDLDLDVQIMAAAAWLQQAHCDDEHPTPVSDGIGWTTLMRRSDWLCAFLSVQDAHNWFTTDILLRLRRLGYVFAAYEVPDVAVKHGEKQVVFIPDPSSKRYVRT